MCDTDEDGDAIAAVASDNVAIGRIEVFMMERLFANGLEAKMRETGKETQAYLARQPVLQPTFVLTATKTVENGDLYVSTTNVPDKR